MRIFRALPSLVVFLIVTACSSRLIYEPHHVDKHSEVGSFQISATLIAPWDEFVADLSPEFDVTEQIALAEAIPRTSIIEKQILNSLAAALKIAPSASPPTSTQTNDNTATGTGEAIPKPTVQMLDRLAATRKFAPSVSPPTSTQTNIHILNAGGTTKETGESTKTKGAGDESNVTDASAPVGILLQSPATKLPSDADNGPGIDPFLKYTAATALYQEVKILNRYIQSAARRHHMVPYLVRLQMTNTPFARHQPYDTYVTVSFFSRVVCERYEKNADGEYKIVKGKKVKVKTCGGRRATPEDPDGKSEGWEDRRAFVVPLIATDNLESLQASKVSNVIRQLSAATSILQGGFAAALGLTSKTEELNAVLANDLNSLMTVGRPTSSTLNVRLGAMQEATARYAMVPRNHNVTLLIMVPEDGNKLEVRAKVEPPTIEVNDVERIRITGSVEYRDAETGKLLKRDSPSTRRQMVQTIFEKISGSDIKIDPEIAEKLMVAIYVNDYKWFTDLLNKIPRKKDELNETPKEKDEPNEISKGKEELNEIPEEEKGERHISAPADLWNALIERNVSSGFFGDHIDLPKSPVPLLPPVQTVLLADDGNKMRARLVDGRGLDPERIAATLTIPVAGGGNISLPATKIQVVADEGLELNFESLASWGVAPEGKVNGKGQIANGSLVLKWRWAGNYLGGKTPGQQIRSYDSIFYKGPKLEARPL